MKYIYASMAVAAGLAAADSISYPTPTLTQVQFTDTSEALSVYQKFSSDLNAYQTSLTAQPEYTAFLSAFSSAAGSSEFNAVFNTEVDTAALLSGSLTATAVPTWWTKLPTSAQKYVTSVYGAQLSIESSDLAAISTGGSSPAAANSEGAAAAVTPAPIMKAAAVAGAGAMAGAMLLL